MNSTNFKSTLLLVLASLVLCANSEPSQLCTCTSGRRGGIRSRPAIVGGLGFGGIRGYRGYGGVSPARVHATVRVNSAPKTEVVYAEQEQISPSFIQVASRPAVEVVETAPVNVVEEAVQVVDPEPVVFENPVNYAPAPRPVYVESQPAAQVVQVASRPVQPIIVDAPVARPTTVVQSIPSAGYSSGG